MEQRKPVEPELRSEQGQGMAEYIIIVILVAIIVLIGVKLFGRSVINQFNNATSEIKDLRQPESP